MQIKTYTKKELRALYNVSRETFTKWINKFAKDIPDYNHKSKLLTPAQVRVIVELLGEP